MDWNLGLLPFIPALPFVAGLLALLLRSKTSAFWLVLAASLASFTLTALVARDRSMLLESPEHLGIIPTGSAHFEVGSDFGFSFSPSIRLGIDGLNVGLLLLTGLVGSLAIVASARLNLDRAPSYFGSLGLLIGLTLLAFLAQDLLVFYIAFELTLIPLFLLVGLWGGPNRQAAAVKMVIFTLAGGLLTLLGILAVAVQNGGGVDFGWQSLASKAAAEPFASGPGKIAGSVVFLLLCAGFVVKIPLVPFHSWQPLAYLEAPTPITAFLSAVLAKLGLYGILRVSFFLMPAEAATVGVQVLVPLAVLSGLYGAFCAYGAKDLKTLLAYGSISHLSVALIGLLSFNRVGVEGALLHMLAHGVITAGLLFAAGALQSREGTLQFASLGGLAQRHRVLAAFLVLFGLASVGVPGLAQFGGEFLCLMGFLGSPQYGQGIPVALGILAGIFLGGWYTVTMLKKVLFGPAKVGEQETVVGLAGQDWIVLVPLALLTFLLGLWPQPFLRASKVESFFLEREVQRAEAGGLASR